MQPVNAENVESQDWLGFEWSDWSILKPGSNKISNVPETPGFFRIKQTSRPGLEYVGQTGRDLKERIVHFANDLSGKAPEGNGSTRHLWELGDSGGRFEFSYMNPNIARSETDRIGLENVMLAMHLKYRGRSPTVNLNRKLSSGENRNSVIESLEWGSGDFTSPDWMGLEWTTPRKLEDRGEIDSSKVVYRIWFPDFIPPLAYIGKSTNVANRLVKHEKKFGSGALFSVAPVDSNLKDVEASLIASHYLDTNTLPKGQDGRRNKFGWK